MNFCGVRQLRTYFSAENMQVHVTFTCSVYVRVQPCTCSVYQAVYRLPPKTTGKASDFWHLTCDKAPSPQAFLTRFHQFEE